MFCDAPEQVAGHAGVENFVVFIRHDVNARMKFSFHLSPLSSLRAAFFAAK
jgi:hypothetical protein